MDKIKVKLRSNGYDVEGAKMMERSEWCGYRLLAGQFYMFKESVEKWLSKRRS